MLKPYSRRIAAIDAGYVGCKDTEVYFAKNNFSAEVLINSWCALCEDISSVEACEALNTTINFQGIIPTIRQCSQDADSIIAGEQPSDLGIVMVKDLSLTDALQLLRYPKRYSPEGADGVHAETLRKFLNRNNLDKMSDRRGYPRWLIRRIREVISQCLAGWDDKAEELDLYNPYSEYYFSKGYFSSGSAAFMLSHTQYDKIKAWELPYYGNYAYPSGSVKFPVDRYSVTTPNHDMVLAQRAGYYCSQVQIVNKSYKSGRVIAKENATRAFFMQGLRVHLQEVLHHNGYEYLMPSEHQEFNGMLAHIGSMTGEFATVDLTSASDSIPCGFVREVFPSLLTHVWDELRSDYFQVPSGKCYISYMANTSGSPLCFDMEKIVFYAIARVASDLSASFGGYKPSLVTAMGDDIIIPAYAYDTIHDLLTMLGIVMNEDKSFSTESQYRESCGYEANAGVTTVTTYFPRKSLGKDVNAIPSLKELHNKLFLKGYRHAAKAIYAALEELKPTFKSRSSIAQYVEYGAVPDLLADLELAPVKNNKSYEDPSVTVPNHSTLLARRRGVLKYFDCNYQTFQYVQYLLHGPLYLTPLDKLLKVSTARCRPEDFTTQDGYKVIWDGGRTYM